MTVKRILSLLLIVTVVMSCVVTAYAAAGKTVYINDLDDLRELAENCRLDTYSQGLTVVLNSDIDLDGGDMSPIPIFSGTFLGSGHTISNLRLSTDGSHQGLFRYIEAGAAVMDLKVTGTVAPNGGREKVGGIAGTNRGTISGCSFDGNISGLTDVGGIAGENLGTIRGCTTNGSVSGKTYTGGIAGFNSGSLLMCQNNASVNTSISLSNLELESFSLSTLTSAEDTDTVSDTGGVVGNSVGMVMDCVNAGTVGYQHYGYNVGGIAGRQSGYLKDCTNTAQVYGRKDVGGIVGQMEPYMELSLSQDIVDELNALHDIIDMTLADANGQSSNMTDALDRISDNSSDAAKSASDLAQHVGTVIDGSVDAVNEALSRLQYVVDNLPPVTENLAIVSQNMSEGLVHLDNCFDTIEMDTETLAELHTDLSDMSDAMEAIDVELQYLKYLIAVYYNKEFEGDYDLKSMRPDNAHQIYKDYGYDYSIDANSSTKKIRKALVDVISDLSDDLAKLNRSTAATIGLLDDYYLAPIYDTDGDGEPDQCRADYASDEGNLARENFKIAADALAAAMRYVDGIAEHLAGLEELQVPNLGSEYYTASDDLFTSLQDMAGNMSSLNASLYQSSDVMTYDLAAVNSQFTKVLTMLADAITGGVDVTIIDDISDRTDEMSTVGRVSGCENYGSVDGDTDVGGIVGAMGIEYEFDLEGEITQGIGTGTILSKTYQTKCVAHKCINYAPINAKKDYAGSIAGLGEIGTIVDCEAYGSAASATGAYVGGIIGSSSTIVRRCSAMCSLSGSEYVGGIAGFGTQITDCRSLVGISDETACCGAIAGYVDFEDENTVVKGNSFVHEKLGGVDGISYAGKAEPMSYADFLQLKDIPEEFSQLTLSFEANGEIIKTISFTYGSGIAAEEIPPVPVREGYTGHWPEYDYSALYFSDVIEAVYIPEQSTMAADTVREGSPMSILLLEGRFEDGACVRLTEYSAEGPNIADKEVLEKWVMHIDTPDDSNCESYSVRYLPPQTRRRSNVDIYMLVDDAWVKVPTGTSGSYLTFDCSGNNAVFSAVESDKHFSPLLIGGGIAGTAALGSAGVGMSINRRKRRRKHR